VGKNAKKQLANQNSKAKKRINVKYKIRGTSRKDRVM
jgi:hypothetical protein